MYIIRLYVSSYKEVENIIKNLIDLEYSIAGDEPCFKITFLPIKYLPHKNYIINDSTCTTSVYHIQIYNHDMLKNNKVIKLIQTNRPTNINLNNITTKQLINIRNNLTELGYNNNHINNKYNIDFMITLEQPTLEIYSTKMKEDKKIKTILLEYLI